MTSPFDALPEPKKPGMPRRLPYAVAATWVLAVLPVQAHVKWFSEFDFNDRPLTLGEAVTPTFIALAGLSMATIALFVYLDRHLASTVWYLRVSEWLEARRGQSVLVMRIGLGATLLLSWQAGTLFVPEGTVSESVGWFQFLVAFLLLFDTAVPLAGIGVMVLFVLGLSLYGAFHMLDYTFFIGVGYYLAVSRSTTPALRGSGVPALYTTLGFSLCWAALEKIVYPQWSSYLLDVHPQLTLGFEPSFFLIGATFVEMSLGYLLIICLLQRPLALLITLVFFLTTMVFGKTEVIGHTIIHAALLVFLLEGPGERYGAPISFLERIHLRTTFAAVSFAFLLAVLMVPYVYITQRTYLANQSAAGTVASGEPRVFFLEPRDGAIVSSPVTFRFGAENFRIEAVAHRQGRDGAGHYQLGVDAECLPPGVIVPDGQPWIHFPDATSEIVVQLEPGPHRFCRQPGDSEHRTLPGDGLAAAIRITVR
ncbi:MAG: DUF4399 domain-containing protein [Vicinamibacterales bacterium]|jgi:hypothetical protein|nr:hypothetical protein [Acidobacteriota bacterium]MDP6610047.1 DUF4399 domain-containing protein [Vicinamibacterales bacterium]|tara:strand:- start:4550 stop:5989 length:1440 start_codon:yes stop_codon:yes gene_type:complete